PRMVGPATGPYAQSHDISVLAARRLEENLYPSLRFDCGTEDFLFPLNEGFHKLLISINYPHSYSSAKGEHNWDYWRQYLPDTLAFFGKYWSEKSAGKVH